MRRLNNSPDLDLWCLSTFQIWAVDWMRCFQSEAASSYLAGLYYYRDFEVIDNRTHKQMLLSAETVFFLFVCFIYFPFHFHSCCFWLLLIAVTGCSCLFWLLLQFLSLQRTIMEHPSFPLPASSQTSHILPHTNKAGRPARPCPNWVPRGPLEPQPTTSLTRATWTSLMCRTKACQGKRSHPEGTGGAHYSLKSAHEGFMSG